MAFRLAFRRLAKSPLFTLLTVATLAIGIGANSAIFSVIDGILIHPLPYSHAEGLERLLAVADALVPQLAQEGRFVFRKRRRGLGFRFEHPRLDHIIWGDLTEDEPSGDSRVAAAGAVVRRFVAYLTTDVMTAADSGSPPGSTVDVHEQLLI